MKFLRNHLPRRSLGLRAGRVVRRSGLFDPDWYAARYPDAVCAQGDPLAHYLAHGGHEGRAPSAAFDGARYLSDHPDVAQAGSNPLLHYLLHGQREGRSYHPVAPDPVSAVGRDAGLIAFCTVVDAHSPKLAIAYSLVASWHCQCRAWSSMHVVLIGPAADFAAFARRLGAEIRASDPHPLAARLAFANKWLLADLDVGAARPIVIDWDIVFVGDPWLLRALPPHCFGARPAPALRLPPALQSWILAQFRLPRGLNVAALELASRYDAAWNPDDNSIPAIAREFRYYNGGLLAVPPGRLRATLQAWQASYECLVDRIRTTPGAAEIPGIEESALQSDQLALALALAWEDVHPLDPTSNFFLFDPKFGYASAEVAMLHLAGPIVGDGLQAVLSTFDSQWERWKVSPHDFPRFDPFALRGKLEALVRDYGRGGSAWKAGWTDVAHGPAAAPGGGGTSLGHDNAYDDPRAIDAAVAQECHRDLVGGLWHEVGRLQFDYLRHNGLRPDQHLLDIGCGSLRGGIHFAAYLQPGRYWGVDAVGSLLRAGRGELDRAGLSGRVPDSNLLEDAEFDFERFGRSFDMALAQSLFTHLSINRIRLCLYRLAQVMPAQGRLFATYFEVPEHHPLDQPFFHPGGIVSYGHKDPFHYRPSAIVDFTASMPWRLVETSEWGHPRDQRMMILERRPASPDGTP